MSLRYSPSLMQTVGPKRWRRPHNWASSCCNMRPIVSCTPATGCVDHKSLYACGGCDIQLARRLGAELAITGTVQKVSNLILNMNIYVRDASSGATIAAMSADMRGNTDQTWSRTLNWLVHNRLLAPGYGLQH